MRMMSYVLFVQTVYVHTCQVMLDKQVDYLIPETSLCTVFVQKLNTPK